MRVLNLGTYLPRQCGIATFAGDLRRALTVQGIDVGALALSDHAQAYAYPPECCFELLQHRPEDYRAAADYINHHDDAELLIVQHEYGIYGGADGEYLPELLAALEKPYMLICHTVLEQPSRHQKEVLLECCRDAAGIVCMTGRSARLLTDLYEAPADFVRVIPHGVPLFRPRPQQRLKEKYDCRGRTVVTTFGLLGPGKGLEIGIDVIARLKGDFPDLLYLILGQTHPTLLQREGERYRRQLEARVRELGVEPQVRFVNRFLSDSDLGDYLYMTDLYLSPYPNLEQAVSGTLAFAVGCGRAVVSTAYSYAQEVLGEGRGMLAAEADPAVLAALCAEVLCDPKLKKQLQRRAHALGSRWPWLAVGQSYAAFIRSILDDHAIPLEKQEFDYA